MNIIQELNWRGIIHNITPGIEEKLNNNKIFFYTGFDPSYHSLHIGNLIPILVLLILKKIGNKPIILIGGATGIIGDPSGKKKERIFLKKEILKKNIISLKNQLINLTKNEVEILNNYDWIKNIYLINFLKKIGKNITINYLFSKDSIKNRIKTGISFTEFSYQLIQAYDFLFLYKKKKCILQIGGSDQWGNITTGIEIIKKLECKKVYGMTFPILTNKKGIKLGKSEKENIWIDKNLTSPHDFYNYFINFTDYDSENFIKFLPIKKKEIIYFINKHKKNPKNRFLQKKIAYFFTKWIHGKKITEKIIYYNKILFDKKKNFKELDKKHFITLSKIINTIKIKKKKIKYYKFIIDILNNFFSKKDILRKIKENSLTINNYKKIKKNSFLIKKNFLYKKYIIIKYGKKKFFLIEIIE